LLSARLSFTVTVTFRSVAVGVSLGLP
jgi:hypothetical protein